MSDPHTLIIRHQKERSSKCSLRDLVGRADLKFMRYPWKVPHLNVASYVRLDFEGPLLQPTDRGRPLLMIDATWLLAQRIGQKEELQSLSRRSLDPAWRTCYPRRQTACSDVERGLASLEALYCARLQQGCEDSSLLEGYHWKAEFMNLNSERIAYWRERSSEDVC